MTTYLYDLTRNWLLHTLRINFTIAYCNFSVIEVNHLKWDNPLRDNFLLKESPSDINKSEYSLRSNLYTIA